MRKVGLIILAGLLAPAIPAVAIPYTLSSSLVSQDFDSLSNTGSSNAWANDTTLAGWYAMDALGAATSNTFRDNNVAWSAVSNYIAGTGSGTTGSLYSFGSSGSTERALGSLGSNSAGDFAYALVLQNQTGFTLDTFSLTYDGEQWRNGNNTVAHVLEFDWAVLAAAPTLADLAGDNVAGYTAEPALNFTGPIAGGSATALDGNAAANRVTGITANVSLNWANGDYLILRWWDNNDIGNDHGLSIDNVNFRATPEPTTLSLLGFSALLFARRRR